MYKLYADRIRFLLVFIGLAMPLSAQDMPSPIISGDPDFIDPGAVLELLVDGSLLGTSLPGDVKVGCDGLVYFSDVTFSNRPESYNEQGVRRAGAIWRYDPETAGISVFRAPSGMANGLAFDAECQLLAAEGADLGGRRVTRTNLEAGTAEIVAGLFEDNPFNAPNDLVIDALGHIYFTDTRYVGHEPIRQDGNAVYRIDVNGDIERLISELPRPNGIAVSPDQSVLYVSNLGGALNDSLWAYRLDEHGSVSSPRLVVDFGEESGADGFVVDAEGNLWVSVLNHTRPGIYAYTPDGVEKAYIEARSPYNTAFGRGAQSHLLYFTAGRHLYRIAVNKPGYHLPRME
ncbi:MAG: hypothetical protein ETSY2_22790 [Candidatus Entotheonella gemina]|uniref:SMP-30/Gluconolactonase/LRE-like region domain-containing protein n=2 Tax=Candidatus Entotheonella TaxID=93171 RepID=W4M5I4_9BACT|nr:MAG: hypothetical protein ETSY2_22790 [Candidatus Entotheonella gemina]